MTGVVKKTLTLAARCRATNRQTESNTGVRVQLPLIFWPHFPLAGARLYQKAERSE